MLSLSRARLVPALVVLAAGLLLPVGAARGQAKQKQPNTKNVPFESHDGVKLSGTLYPNPGGKKEAVVMLLHDPKGGGAQQKEWTNLAAALQKDGYAVFLFDFRGFGDSKNLADKDRFWKQPHNTAAHFKTKGATKKETLDHKDFRESYLAYLVNDIAAAKAYLDRRNDNKELNSSNLIVIGAGEGATLGAMWLANESRRRKDKGGGVGIGAPAQMGDPEVRDVAAAVWLTISPKIGSRNAPLSKWVPEAGRDHKVPTLFVYGQGDGKGDNLSLKLYQSINPKGEKSKDFKRTGRKRIPDTKLTGHSLLGVEETIPAIREHLKEVLEDRGSRESFKREVDKHRYVYTIRGKYSRDNKKAGEEVPPVDVNFLGLGR